ncbi:hypothetical protein K501DRAFT_92621, partial [Backusella circina FSU 941]
MRTVNRQRIITACSMMVFGTLVSSMGYLNFSLAGIFYAISWPAIFALYGIYMKRSLLALKNDYWTLIQYNLIVSAIVLVPFSFLSGEISDIFSTVWFWDEVGFWIQMIITSVIGLGVNVLMVLVLIYTSPVTLIVLAVTKTAIQALLVALLFGNRISFLNTSGLIIVLASSAFYGFSRYEESNS